MLIAIDIYVHYFGEGFVVKFLSICGSYFLIKFGRI